MNFCLFLLSMILIVAVNELMWKPELWTLLRSRKYFISLYEYMYSDATHDSVPVVEYFSSYLRVPWLAYVLTFLKTFTLLNLGLALFNLLPIPPLDGYHVVNDIFLRGKLHLSARVVQYISLGLMAFIFIPRFTGLPDYFSLGIGTAIEFIYENVQKAILAVAGLG
ncbi:MAG: site-2 protease family protein [Clostridia bacterium]|nr:site-2 protease family protein [Clostridia bacterium]